jgi:hypothetical protein
VPRHKPLRAPVLFNGLIVRGGFTPAIRQADGVSRNEQAVRENLRQASSHGFGSHRRWTQIPCFQGRIRPKWKLEVSPSLIQWSNWTGPNFLPDFFDLRDFFGSPRRIRRSFGVILRLTISRKICSIGAFFLPMPLPHFRPAYCHREKQRGLIEILSSE